MIWAPRPGWGLIDRELLVGERPLLSQESSWARRSFRCGSRPARKPHAGDPLFAELELSGDLSAYGADGLRVPRAAAEAQVDRFGQIEHQREEPLGLDGSVGAPPMPWARAAAGLCCGGAVAAEALGISAAPRQRREGARRRCGRGVGKQETPKLIVTGTSSSAKASCTALAQALAGQAGRPSSSLCRQDQRELLSIHARDARRSRRLPLPSTDRRSAAARRRRRGGRRDR